MWSEDLLQSVHSLKWEKRVKYVDYGGDGVIVYRYMFYISTYIYMFGYCSLFVRTYCVEFSAYDWLSDFCRAYFVRVLSCR